MGSYSSTLALYKPAPSEYVQLNRNLDIADATVKRCLEYEYSSVAFPDMTNYAFNRAKFYRMYSNSIVQWRRTGTTWYQDPAAQVHKWVNVSSTVGFGLSWQEHPDYPVDYSVVQKAGGTTAEVEFTGAIWWNGSPIDIGFNVAVLNNNLPVGVRPATTKYFNCWGGNTSTNFCMARILIGDDGRMECKVYGVNPSAGSSDENRIDLQGIRYNVEVTGT